LLKSSSGLRRNRRVWGAIRELSSQSSFRVPKLSEVVSLRSLAAVQFFKTETRALLRIIHTEIIHLCRSRSNFVDAPAGECGAT
jgi:hypothetical protein